MTEFEERARELGRRFGKESTTEVDHDMDRLFCKNLNDREFFEELGEVMDKHNVRPIKFDNIWIDFN